MLCYLKSILFRRTMALCRREWDIQKCNAAQKSLAVVPFKLACSMESPLTLLSSCILLIRVAGICVSGLGSTFV